MNNWLEQLSQIPSQRRLHRIVLIPLIEVLQTQTVVKVPESGVMKRQEDVLVPLLLDPPKMCLEPGNQTETLELLDLGIDGDFETTLPSMAATRDLEQQDQSLPMVRSETLETLDLAIDDDPEATLPKIVAIRASKLQGQLPFAVKSEKLEAFDQAIYEEVDAKDPSMVMVVVGPSDEQDQSSPQMESEKLETLDAAADRNSEFEKHPTLPMEALKRVSQQQSLSPSTMQSEISGAASGGAFIGIGAIWGYILKYADSFLLQRGLGAALFGLYSLGLSMVTLVASVFSLGLDDAMIRYVAIYRGKQQKNLLRNLTIFCTAAAGGSGILGALLVLYFAPFLVTLGEKHNIVPLVQIMAPLIPLACIQVVWTAGLQGFKEFKKRVLLENMIGTVIELPLLALVLLLFPHSVRAVAVLLLVCTIISTLLNLSLFFRTFTRTTGSGPEKYELREWFGFAAPNFLTSIVDIVLDTTDTLLLAYFAISYSAIGQYNAAIKISGFISMPLNALNRMFAPTIAELHSKGEEQKLEVMFKLVTKWAITFSLPIFGISALFSTSLLGLSGNSFVAAWPLLLIFAVAGMSNVATGSVGVMLLMTGHQKFSFLNSLAAVIVNIILGIILTPRFGAMGTAASTAIATCVVNLMRLFQVRLLLKIQPYQRDTLKPVGAGVISATLTGGLLYLLNLAHWSAQLFHTYPFIELALIPVFLVSYIWLLVLFKTGPEDKIVLDMLRKKFKRGNKHAKK